MKTKHFLLTGTMAVALTGFLLIGCSKKESTAPVPPTNSADYTAAQDNANASSVIDNTKNISDDAKKGQTNEERMLSGCETMALRDTNSHADSLLDIYFGANDCTCTDGKKRRGHVLVWFKPGNYFTQGDTITESFRNYYVNDIGVTGTRQLINIGLDTNGFYSWSFSANLTLAYPGNNGTATWISNRTNTLLKSGGNWYYSVSGVTNGVSRTGHNYTITITSPIYVTAWPWWLGGCQYFESGSLTINVSGAPYPIYVSYGTGIGNCNSAMTATINGQTYNLVQM